jgi:hypothetical protein
MKKSILLKHSVFAIVMCLAGMAYGQDKLVETFDVSKDVVVEVNTSHTNVIFKTWNKNKVQVEAFIDDKSLSEKEMQQALEDWDLDVLGNSQKIVVTSGENYRWRDYDYNFKFKELEDLDLNLEFLGPLLEDLEIPELNIEIPEIPEIPEMPEIIWEGMGDLNFDYEEFQENEEEYMEQWNEMIEERFGEEFEEKMEAWGERFAEKWNEKKGDSLAAAIEGKMKVWEEKHAKKMDKLAEEMEKRAEEIEKKAEEYEKKRQKMEKDKYEAHKRTRKVNRTIIIKMPKDTRTDINVRHGELKMADAYNVRANLNYSPFTATSIDGGNTLINASYAPVIVDNWIQGELIIKYVENCKLDNTTELVLKANSCDVQIGTIGRNANLSGSYGMLNIENISSSFEYLNIQLVNTDAFIKIPATEFSYNAAGTYSSFKIPSYLDLRSNDNLNKKVNITATYSNVTLH